MSRVLFDQNVPRALSATLLGFEVQTAAELGWAELANGDLLTAAAAAGFSLIVTCDQNISYQQNMKDRPIAMVVLSTNHWATLRANAPLILRAVEHIEPLGFTFVDCPLPGRVRRPPPKRNPRHDPIGKP